MTDKEQIKELQSIVDDLESTIDCLNDDISDLEDENERLSDIEDFSDKEENIENILLDIYNTNGLTFKQGIEDNDFKKAIIEINKVIW